MKKRVTIVYLVLVIFIVECMVACGNRNNDVPADVTTAVSTNAEIESDTDAIDKSKNVGVDTIEDSDTTQTDLTVSELEPEVSSEPTLATPEPETSEPEVAPEPTSEPEVPETQVTEPATAVSITAKVSGKHTVGENLSVTDFTITVSMSDGSTIKNPAGWNANPLTLSSETTVITVTYNGLSTTVTVNASQPVTQQPVVQQSEPQPEPSVGEPPLPSGGWPASAYGPVTDAAIADCYNYALAHGWTAITGYSDAFGGGSATYYSKNGQDFVFSCGYFCVNAILYFPGEYSMVDVYNYIDSI